MPELPEVETTKCSISILVSQTIKNILIYQPKLREVISNQIYSLINQKIQFIERRAKYLIFRTIKGDILIHLGMSGYFKLIDKNNSQALTKHDRVDFVFNNHILRFNDIRRFGLVQYHKDAYQSKQITNLGLEPFDLKFDANHLHSFLIKSQSPIKFSLMNSKIVVGVGNIYANEVLFSSKIHPVKASNKITKPQCKTLVYEIKRILAEAIKSGGTSFRNFKHSDGKIGHFQQYLKIYNRKGQPCFNCQSLIKVVSISNRSSYFCPNCQK